MKLKRSREKKHRFVRLTRVPFLCIEEEEEEEEIPTVSSCVTEVSRFVRVPLEKEEVIPTTEVSTLSRSVSVDFEEKKKKKMGKRGESKMVNGGIQIVDSSVKDQPESSRPSSKKTKINSGVSTPSAKLPTSRSKALEIAKTEPRRSQRIKDTPQHDILHPGSIEPVIEHIDASDGDDEDVDDDLPCPHESEGTPTEEKVVHMMLLMEQQWTAFKSLLSEKQGSKSFFMAQNSFAADTEVETEKGKYKFMYIDSQKKIAELKEENSELRKKLEIAEAKFEGYEQGQRAFSDTLEKLKDTCLVSALAKTTEMAMRFPSSRTNFGGLADPVAYPEANKPATARKVKKKPAKKATEA